MNQDHDPAIEEKPSSRRPWQLGVVVALGGGLAWGLLAVATGYQLVWLAPLIGLLVAVVIRDESTDPAPRTAFAAAGLTLAGLILAQIVMAVVGAHFVSAHEVRTDPGLVTEAVMVYLAEHGQTIAPGTTYMEYESILLERIDQMSPADKQSIVRWYLSSSNTSVTRAHRPGGLSGVRDLWWWAGALVLAYFLAKRPKAGRGFDADQATF